MGILVYSILWVMQAAKSVSNRLFFAPLASIEGVWAA